MPVSHAGSAVSAVFDDPNLVSCASLVPIVALAQRCGLKSLVATLLTLPGAGGVNAVLKVPALIAGMVAGADSIDDMDLLRRGGMRQFFTGIRAPSTLGTFLRTFTFGHVPTRTHSSPGDTLPRSWGCGEHLGHGQHATILPHRTPLPPHCVCQLDLAQLAPPS